MPLFRKKPVVIEARQFNEESRRDIIEWLGSQCQHIAIDDEGASYELANLRIRTLESGGGHTHIASPGDWIIKGVQGEFYPCKPDIFAATYEQVEG